MREIHIPVRPGDEAITIVITVPRRGASESKAPGAKLGPHAIVGMISESLAATPDDLRSAVQSVLANDRPPRTVSGWARACGLSRSTLWRRWVMHMGSAVRPADFLRAVLAVRALQLAERGIPRSGIARALRLDVRTVKAMCEPAATDAFPVTR